MAVADVKQKSASRAVHLRGLLSSPLAWLAAACLVCVVLLMVPLKLTLGPMYWDVYIYYDAANRILSGQIPFTDFFVPVGPVIYFFTAELTRIFPNGQPFLLTSWSILVLSAPIAAVLVWDVGKRSKPLAFALLVPFLFFSLLSFNTRDYYPVVGADGFGVYNRHGCQLLYLLAATFLFARTPLARIVLVTATMASLFFVKINGFAAGGIICAYAFLVGRIDIRETGWVIVGFAAIVLGVEIFSGIIEIYLIDIFRLVGLNDHSLLSRIRETIATNFDIAFLGLALVAVLAWRQVPAILKKAGPSAPYLQRARLLLDSPAAWFALSLAAAIFFDSQNTGSQAFILLWPAILKILLGLPKMLGKPVVAAAVVALCAAVMLPQTVNVLHRAGKTFIGGANDPVLESANLRTLGAVRVREEVTRRADTMRAFYVGHRQMYDDLIAADEYPSPTYPHEIHFQSLVLTTADEAINAIRRLEGEHGIRFETILSLHFVNPFPWLMDRRAPVGISIAADPFRTIIEPDERARAAVADTDLALYPTCPTTLNNARIAELYAEPLAHHSRIRLTDCYEALVHPRFGISQGG